MKKIALFLTLTFAMVGGAAVVATLAAPHAYADCGGSGC